MNLRMTLGLGVIGLSLGCSEAIQPSATVTPAEFNVSGAPTVQFSVPDMMCEEGCAATVKEILSKQPGVKEAVVDFDAKTATVAVEEGEFDAQAALAALVDKQFDHSSIKNTAESAARAGSSGDDAAAAATPPAAVN